MHGITVTSKPEDWEILQQKEGSATVTIAGTYQVHPAAIEVGVESAIPMVRVMREADNMTVIPWTEAKHIEKGESFTGAFETTIEIPAGGLYRIDTALETKSTQPNLTWLYRGDCALHIGVGNLFIIAGQSNAAGYSRDYVPDPPHLCVHLYRNRGKWDLASHPMNESTDANSLPNEEMGIPGVSPYLSFAKSYYELTGMPVGLIQTSLGGSPMQRWNPQNGDLYANMINKIQETGGNYAGMLWYQGCSDTEPVPAAHYLEHFQTFVEALRKEVGYELPIFTFQLNRQINGIHSKCWGMVREAQRRAALELPGVYVLPTTNCSLCDGIHNTAQANVVLGLKAARQCFHVLNGGEEFAAPSLGNVRVATQEEKETLQVTGLWWRLTFEHVKNCLLIFSTLGTDSGFTLEDDKGVVEILTIRSNREDRNHIYLELGRKTEGAAYLSYAWEADPIKMPLLDETTYLPPLSFYRVLVEMPARE